LTSWGINVPSKVTVAVSEDGKTYTNIGAFADPEGLTRKEEGAVYTLEMILEEGVSARYVKITPTRISFFFWSEIEVIRNEIAQNYIVPEVDVPVTGNLTDKVTDVNANWGAGAGNDNVTLITNPNCKYTHMDVSLTYDLGGTKKINSAALYFYHCAGVMIGYPEGDVTILSSVDGKTYTEIGTFALEKADLAVGSYGTVKSFFVFDTTEAAYVKFVFKAGSNRLVLGDSPADGKVNWEFVALTEVEVIDESIHVHDYQVEILAEPTLSVPGEKKYTCSRGGTYTEVYPLPVQPDVLVDLPKDAYTLDYAGYKHAGAFSIVAGDNMTIAELTKLGYGLERDMNYAYIIVVDGDGIVTQTWYKLGEAKSDVVCPEGGYIISYNGNKTGYDKLNKIKVGYRVTLINVDVDAFRGWEGNMELTKAGFLAEEPFDFGDVNGDGKVNTADYVVLKRHIMKTYTLNEDALTRANINGDTKLNTADYVLLKRYIMGSWKPN
jgi:hypothetical protein